MNTVVQSRHASAMILTLWCVAVLSITVIAVARMVERDVQVEGVQNRRFEARELALTGIAYGFEKKIMRWDSLLNQKLPDGSELHVREVSEASRLDINQMLREPEQLTLHRLFRIWGLEPDEIGMVIDSLVDWVDSDDFRMLNGAEKDDLANQNLYTIPANRDFYSVDEMERVRGMDLIAARKPDWRETFTVHGGRRVDIQDASLEILEVVGGMSPDMAIAIDQLRRGADGEPYTRDDFKIQDVGAVFDQLGFRGQQAEIAARRFGPASEPTRVESTAIVGGTPYRITAVVNRDARGDDGLILWQEL